jgi:undecaprenyl-diphosphatase
MTPDEMILFWLHSNLASQYSDAIFYWFSSRSAFSIPILLTLLIVAIQKEQWRGVGWWLALIIVVAIGDQFGNLLKSLFTELRPCAHDLNYREMAREFSCSSVAKGMPSNHALTFYTASVFVILTRPTWRRWHLLLLTTALLTSLSRIYLAKHYPSQVVAGVFLGINIGVVAAVIYRIKLWLDPLSKRVIRLAKLEPWNEHLAKTLQKSQHYSDQVTSEGSSHG